MQKYHVRFKVFTWFRIALEERLDSPYARKRFFTHHRQHLPYCFCLFRGGPYFKRSIKCVLTRNGDPFWRWFLDSLSSMYRMQILRDA